MTSRSRTAMAAGVLLCMMIGACSASRTDPVQSSSDPSPVTSSPTATASSEPSALAAIPTEARITQGGTEPRSGGYWIMWSTCGENSQAAVAAANGGREAGWLLLDDLLEDPGVALGGYEVKSCEEAVGILDVTTEPAVDGADTVPRLAAEVMTAQLNASSGGETCLALDGALAVASALLTEHDYQGADRYRRPEGQLALAVEESEAVLSAYNDGSLCR